jgi:hypothetical protein
MTMGEWAKLLADRLISVPFALVIMCFIFRKPLGNLISELAAFVKRADRMSLKRGNTSLEARANTASQPQNDVADPEAKFGAGSPISLTKPATDDLESERRSIRDYGKGMTTVRLQQEEVRAELNRLGFSQTDAETVDILIWHLAASQCVAFFERTYRIIYGSQLDALDHLNSYGKQSLAFLGTVFFDTAKKLEESFYGDTTFDQWFSFLVNYSLVEVQDQSASITVRGRDFLLWIVNVGLPRHRHH